MRNSEVSRSISQVLTLILLMVVAVGYAQPQKTGGSTAASAPRVDALQEQIVAQERAGLDALKTGDLTTFGASTADDAIFVDAQGPATKAEVMEHTAQFRLHDYTMSNVRFVKLSPDSGLIVYTATESGSSHGKDFTARVHVSSVWIKRDGKWLCEFSQETGAR
jgi:ketosteroid isomerase-like protein